ncbi:hypothetical protein [Sorangium sp. So ce363]|uniref:hypothetical protein n=1 Tax=Sorangium sp. So ce363 TaxID=3133304 RepID=UPI003F5DF7CC
MTLRRGTVHLAPWAKLPAGYAPHRPEETVLHGLVRENLESFLAHARLNLSLHYHALVSDGVFLKNKVGQMSFRDTLAPSAEALAWMVRRVRERAVLWLRKRRFLEDRPFEERAERAIPPTG